MNEIILYLLLSIIAVCLIVMVYYFAKLSKKKETTNTQSVLIPTISSKSINTTPCAIPDDVAFDNRNLPYRISRSTRKKVNYGKDFNAYLVKGGTIYHKKSCKRLNGKKVVIKHIYECIADKNKKACPYCKPRTKIHKWYEEKFPDSVFVQSVNSPDIEKNIQLSLIDVPCEDSQDVSCIQQIKTENIIDEK